DGRPSASAVIHRSPVSSDRCRLPPKHASYIPRHSAIPFGHALQSIADGGHAVWAQSRPFCWSPHSNADREVVQCGEVSKIAAVAAKQYLAQINQAVDRLFDRSEIAGGRAV